MLVQRRENEIYTSLTKESSVPVVEVLSTKKFSSDSESLLSISHSILRWLGGCILCEEYIVLFTK